MTDQHDRVMDAIVGRMHLANMRGRESAVYLGLFVRSNEDLVSFPVPQQVAWENGIAESRVWVAFAGLEATHLIRRVDWPGAELAFRLLDPPAMPTPRPRRRGRGKAPALRDDLATRMFRAILERGHQDHMTDDEARVYSVLVGNADVDTSSVVSDRMLGRYSGVDEARLPAVLAGLGRAGLIERVKTYDGTLVYLLLDPPAERLQRRGTKSD